MSGLILTASHFTPAQNIGNPDADSLNVSCFFALSDDIHQMYPIDTSLSGIQRYNPLSCFHCFYITNGNTGQPHLSLIPNFTTEKGFDFGIHPFRHFYLKAERIPYFSLKKPYTRVFYVMGSKKEQNLTITHSQNVAEWFNLGLQFDYVNSPGYYKRQFTDNKNFSLNGHFKTKNDRYHIFANYIHNKSKIQENGGIKYDSVFEKNIITSRESITVNLNSTENKLKENNYLLKQVFFFQKDTALKPAEETATTSWSLNPSEISHTFLFRKRTRIHSHSTDDNSFYNHTFDTINPTLDSTLIYMIENKLGITNKNRQKNKYILWFLSLTHQYAELSGYAPKNYFLSVIPAFSVSFQPTDNLNLELSTDYCFGDYYNGDYHAHAKLRFNLKPITLEFLSSVNASKGGYFYHSYKSNHFIWENSFQQQKIYSQTGTLDFKGYQLNIKYHSISNFIYLDTLPQASRHAGDIQAAGIYFNKTFRYVNWSARLNAGYQNSSDESVLPVPEWLANISLYYTRNVFKSVAVIEPGVDLLYFSSYIGYTYMPALMSFYPQNHKKVGNYWYADAFLNVKIKRAMLFIKYQNLGYLFGRYTYYTVPSYPMPDGGLRFGVSWTFYD
ncbi:MAG: hypothetical protein JXA03_04665 [Bacteroidales bacterium]|nr:hypothetical protein [Bacteroidales bacterium]